MTARLQYAHITVTSVQQLLMLQNQTSDDVVDGEARHPCKRIDNESNSASQSTLSISTKSESRSFYSRALGTVNLQRRRKFVRTSACSYPGDGKLAVDDIVITIQPSFMQYSFDMSFVAGMRFIPKTLTVYHTISIEEPIIDYVCGGSLSTLQLALQNGVVSPFVTDECGDTLLHVCSHAKALIPLTIALIAISGLRNSVK